MPERARDLHETLEALHRSLASEADIDDALRRELRQAMEEIRERLEEEEPELETSLLERVRQLMLRYEGQHPTLAEAVGRVVGALARLGI